MSGRMTDFPALARRQSQLMQLVTYDMLVLNQMRNPLE
jgi:hypothetical protein